MYDVRKCDPDYELNCFEGSEGQVSVVRWHPHKEELFASSHYDGQIIFWAAQAFGSSGMLHKVDAAHKSMIWGMAWHPSGQILASTGNDWKVRYWGTQKPYEELNNQLLDQQGYTSGFPPYLGM